MFRKNDYKYCGKLQSNHKIIVYNFPLIFCSANKTKYISQHDSRQGYYHNDRLIRLCGNNTMAARRTNIDLDKKSSVVPKPNFKQLPDYLMVDSFIQLFIWHATLYTVCTRCLFL